MTISRQISKRVLVQLRLALLADCGCENTLADLDFAARRVGLTGAEIDAALAGTSFGAQTAAALAFACALKTGDQGQIDIASARAMRLGFVGADLEALTSEVSFILAGQTK